MQSSDEQVVLVDETDAETGQMEKLEAHRRGALHRAISVFVFDGAGHVLLQKRRRDKYHSQGLWSNACCSHPRPGEIPFAAARRRLREEMGFDCPLRFLFRTVYRHDVGGGLIEHEFVHAFAGMYDGPVRPDPVEADGYEWLAFDALVEDARRSPERYSPWLRIYLDSFESQLRTAAEPA